MQAFAETNDPRKTVDHPKAIAGWRAHQHAAIIGAQIERGKRRSQRSGLAGPLVSRAGLRVAVGRCGTSPRHRTIVVRAWQEGQEMNAVPVTKWRGIHSAVSSVPGPAAACG